MGARIVVGSIALLVAAVSVAIGVRLLDNAPEVAQAACGEPLEIGPVTLGPGIVAGRIGDDFVIKLPLVVDDPAGGPIVLWAAQPQDAAPLAFEYLTNEGRYIEQITFASYDIEKAISVNPQNDGAAFFPGAARASALGEYFVELERGDRLWTGVLQLCASS